MNRLLAVCFALVGGLAFVSTRAQIVIGFDEFPPGTVITNQYAAATFSSSPGHENYVVPGPDTPPNMLCSGSGGVPTCMENTYLDFTMPLFHLDFVAIIQNSMTGTIAQFNIFEHGIHTRTMFLEGPGHPELRTVDLLHSDFMTRLEIVNIVAPIGWDNFILDQVPEPSSALFMCSALLLLWQNKARRTRKHSA